MAATRTSESISLRQHVVYICSRSLAYGLPLLFFLVTTSFYLKTYDSAQVKITFTQVGTTLLFLIWMTKILVEGRFPFRKGDWVYVAPFLAFLASGLMAYVHTPFKVWALDETLRRVFYMLLALIVVAEMQTEERMTRLWRWLMASAWVAIGYGVIQYIDGRFFKGGGAGIDPFVWRQAFGHRVFSTFGNPNFYGNFLVIMTPLIIASVLRAKGSLLRACAAVLITLGLIFFIDKMTLQIFGGYDPSYQVVFGAAMVALMVAFAACCFWRAGTGGSVSMFLVLAAILFLNLYATETKGAWLGFMSAIGVTTMLILEYFLHLEERPVDPKRYLVFALTLIGLLAGVLALMVWEFILPLFQDTVFQIGFRILWIPTALAGLASVATVLWILRQPWNMKKVVYGFLIAFMIAAGGMVLHFAKFRLVSVSFRIFTWISTWEMIRTSPVLGNGVGTFKVIYPAYRRPQIIVLEGKSNTETDHSEDEYLEVWQDEGIIGFGIFIWMAVTAIICGFKQLRWYSKLRVPDAGRRRKILEIDSDPRSYEVLGFLGGFIGALIHWTVDVSIRFVSSGVFSGLLPGALVAYARNHEHPIPNEVRLPYERWIRVGLAALWACIFLWLGMELVPQSLIENGDTSVGQIRFFAVLAGAALFILMELLEIGNAPEKEVPFEEQYPPPAPTAFPVRAVFLILVMIGGAYSLKEFGNQFMADVHHNLAIFFSKQSIWTKTPRYDAASTNLPPDIRKQYQRYGGALEHYDQVKRKNHAFPMAWYFTGNVYNDWGSQVNADSLNTRAKGDLEEAARFRQKSLEMWAKAQEAYESTKKIAPNYVQTHHQMGLLFMKRAEQARQWGEEEKARQFFAEAHKNFELYRTIDPVFPPNYDHIVQIALMQGDTERAKKLYEEAIYYNETVGKSINKVGFPDRVAAFSLSLAKLYYTEAVNRHKDPFHPPVPEIDQALAYFKKAAENEPRSAEAWKGLGFVLQKLGKNVEAQAAFRQALQLAPNDPEIRAQ